MPANYVLLEKITVGATSAASVTFSGIPQTGYSDLVVKLTARSAGAGTPQIRMTMNGSSSAIYSYKNLYGDGSGVASSDESSISDIFLALGDGTAQTSNTFTNHEIYIPNYTSSSRKVLSSDSVMENNATLSYQNMVSGVFASSSPITSLTFTMGNNFAQYSTFYLYGVAKLGTTPTIAPLATGGDIIDTDGTYWYHTFLSSGTFTPVTDLSCDYLVVAGGGGGGEVNTGVGFASGGGGAGGYRTSIGGSRLSLSTIAYTVLVGAGGDGGSGTSGTNSSAFSVAATGGGRGGAGSSSGVTPAATGGSGGGGGSSVQTTGASGNAGGYSPVEGYAGANATGSAGGGGGGAGGNASGITGGVGVDNSISGTSVTYAKGGNSQNNTGSFVATPAGFGNGGNNGRSQLYVGGNGNSGVVIVRYAV